MSQTTEFHVVPAPIRSDADHRRHGPDHYYVENVWLPVTGPAAYVVWRHLARLATRSPRQTISLPRLAAVTGSKHHAPEMLTDYRRSVPAPVSLRRGGECASSPERARPPAAACSLSSAPSLGASLGPCGCGAHFACGEMASG
jgi:hypothetical protein